MPRRLSVDVSAAKKARREETATNQEKRGEGTTRCGGEGEEGGDGRRMGKEMRGNDEVVLARCVGGGAGEEGGDGYRSGKESRWNSKMPFCVRKKERSLLIKCDVYDVIWLQNIRKEL